MKRMVSMTLISILAIAIRSDAGAPTPDFATSRIESMASQERRANVSIVIPADCCTFTVELSNDDADMTRRLQDLQAAIQMLEKNIPDNAQVRGDSAADILVKYGQQSSSGRKDATLVHPSLVFPLTKDSTEFDIIRKVHASIAKVAWPGRVAARITWHRLAIRNPEQHRPQLLSLIKKDVDSVRKIFSPKAKVQLLDLQSPVEVGDHSDTHVELLLNYTMNVFIEE